MPETASKRQAASWLLGPAALAFALLLPRAALATEVPFGSQSVISTNADIAFSVFAADLDEPAVPRSAPYRIGVLDYPIR